MAARLRQAAAAAMVGGRDRLPAVRGRLGLLPDRADHGARRVRAGVGAGAAAGRRRWRIGRGADRRRAALLRLHRREVQSRRDPAAVLGARRPVVPRRAAHRTDARLDTARHRARRRTVGEIFRRHPGGAARALSAPRPRCAASAADRRPIRRGADRPRDRGAALGLAGAERFPALPLCRGARRAGARPDRPRVASPRLRGRPDPLAAAGRADRTAAGAAAPAAARAPRSTPSTGGS